MILSIVTVNLNNKDGLITTIESVVSQSFKCYEFIVIDGGSTDGSVDVIKQYADKIVFWTSEPDNGIYHAMNKGIAKAKGEFCLFLNSGDYLISPNILNKIFQLSWNTDIFCFRYKNKEVDELTFYDFYTGSLMHQSMFIRTELFDKLGMYDESYKIISDWIFYVLAIVKNNCSISFYNFPLYKAQEGGISWTDGDRMFEERERFMKEHFNFINPDYKQLQKYKQSNFVQLYEKIIANPLIMAIYRVIKKH